MQPYPATLDPTTLIGVAELPALQAALWDQQDTMMSAETLLHLYEDRWSYIDQNEMDANEAALLKRLVHDVGNEVFLG